MKIRLGFVSNSSSTSYVIALTRDFRATPEQLEEFIKEIKGYDDDAVAMTTEQATKDISKIVESLCKTGSWSWGEGWDISETDENMEHFHSFFCACGDSVRVSDADGGCGDDFLHNILADDIKNKTAELIEGKKDEDS